MLRETPSESAAFRTLLADLHDDLQARSERLRLLWSLESDYGAGSLWIPGGHAASIAYVELRHAFVSGNFISTVLLAQCLMENLLAAHVGLDATSAEIQKRPFETLADRPAYRDTLTACRRLGVLSEHDEASLRRLVATRNALAHFRSVDDQTNLDRRAMDQRQHAGLICFEDARFAMALVVRVLGNEAFLIGDTHRR